MPKSKNADLVETLEIVIPSIAEGFDSVLPDSTEAARLLCKLGLVCKTTRDHPATKQKQTQLADALIQYIVSGKENEAKALIMEYPFLLKMKGSARDKDERLYENVYPRVAAVQVLDEQMVKMIDEVGIEQLEEQYTPIAPEDDIDTYMSQLQEAAEKLNPILDESINTVVYYAENHPRDILLLLIDHLFENDLNTTLTFWLNTFIDKAKSLPAAAIPYVLHHFWKRVDEDASIYNLRWEPFMLLLRKVERVVIACGTSELHQLYHQGLVETSRNNKPLQRLHTFPNLPLSCQLRPIAREDFSFFIDVRSGRRVCEAWRPREYRQQFTLFSEIMSNKSNRLKALMQPQISPEKSGMH